MITRNIYLTRHGQDQDNVRGILNGRRDEALTALGEEQARRLAKQIKSSGLNFSAVYTSPLQRARNTAIAICSEIGGTATVDELLIERDFGIMTGRQQAEIDKYCAPDVFKTETINYFLSPEGAETFPELIERAKKLLKNIDAQKSDGNILLVTHGDIGKMIYAAYYNLDWREVLAKFHFGNSDLLILSADSGADEAHVFKNEQYNL